jgi:DNA polymerase I/DNA polymerase-2
MGESKLYKPEFILLLMKIEFIPISYDYVDINGKNIIRMFGRDEKGKIVCVLDDVESFFYLIPEKEKDIEKIAKKIEKLEFEEELKREIFIKKVEVVKKNFLEKPIEAIKIYVSNHKDINRISAKIKEICDCNTFERDINLVTKYILEKKIRPLFWHQVSGEVLNNSEEFGGIDRELNVDLVIKAEEIKQLDNDKEFKPNIMAYDIEAEEFEVGRGKILMISLVSDNFKKVLTWKKCSNAESYVECLKDEAEMLEKFTDYINKEKPDVLVGYFSDGFDLPYLRARAEKNKVKLALGLDGSSPTFSGGMMTSGKIAGIVHVDLFKFIQTVYSQYLQSETLSLNEVASELLEDKKLDIEHLGKKTEDIKEHEWKEYFAYNLQDSVLTYRLAEKIWPDMLEFSKVIQEPLFDITRDSMSQLIENYILHHLSYYNEIAEKRPLHEEISERRNRERVEGAFVLQPKAGLYENVVVFDFTSMHTSIIVSFNISKSTLLEKKEKDCYESPEVEWEGKKVKFYFTKKPGFLPQMMKDIIEKRKKYKQEYKNSPNPITKARSNAFKLLSAAIHGYIGFFGARYYSLESSASILAFVRKFNKETIEKTIKAGYNVIYSDTDSIAFTFENKSKEEVLNFLKKLNSELPGIMELELEDFYKRGIWVTKRTGEFGAKKKYALINEKGKLKIRGFETVRRDWCDLAREVQSNILKDILEKGKHEDALKYVKRIIKEIKERKVPLKELTVTTQLRKPISEYKSNTPHVAVAKKMQEAGMPVDIGMLMKYYIAESNDKKALVRDRVKLADEKGKYDINYYVKSQMLPAVENIFQVFGISAEEISDGKKQMKLEGF